eukprot:scaffold1905_cov48-Attheya_sp.AAC.3
MTRELERVYEAPRSNLRKHETKQDRRTQSNGDVLCRVQIASSCELPKMIFWPGLGWRVTLSFWAGE